MTRTACYLPGLFAIILAAGCAELAPVPPAPSDGHLRSDTSVSSDTIPPLVTRVPVVPPPEPSVPVDVTTVSVIDAPVKEVLHALARDASINIDVHPEVAGTVTLNAVDQTLMQILERIARQADIRYATLNGTIVVEPDTPYLRNYEVNYVNVSRDSDLEMRVAMQIVSAVDGGAASSGNNSTSNINSISNNRFWETLTRNLIQMLGEEVSASGDTGLPGSTSVIPNAETGFILVNATAKQHEQIQAFVDRVVASARRQVLIEATVIEVELSDKYQAGIDWEFFRSAGDTGIGSTLNLVGPPPTNALTTFTLDYINPAIDGLNISATIQALEQFGEARVLSSPRLTVINNQPAVLNVSENRVYFTIESDTTQNVNNTLTSFTTTPHTVPVGFVMNVTPQINANDSVLLTVRPTISRIVGFVSDPNPALRTGIDGPPIVSQVPEIAVRELESIISVNNGQIAVLGGLMQDSATRDRTGVPLLSRLPIIGESLFTGRTSDFVKTELVVFLRPVVVRNPGVDGDFEAYRALLERETGGR